MIKLNEVRAPLGLEPPLTYISNIICSLKHSWGEIERLSADRDDDGGGECLKMYSVVGLCGSDALSPLGTRSLKLIDGFKRCH